MDAIALRIFGLFLPAGIGLLVQMGRMTDWTTRGLALAILILGADLAGMAIVDLQQAAIGQMWGKDERVVAFRQITWSTIGLELVGLYGAMVDLGWGSAIVLLSQLWFNLLAQIQIQPQATVPIIPFGLRDRWLVLLADGVGLGLVGLWVVDWARPGVAIVLLGMVVLYSGIKRFGSVN
ncbi:MAG: hypothetical protein VKJ24_13610 [Synechococcales bacterium]|nr:hypothetical protein [Synechococcales bacterium]